MATKKKAPAQAVASAAVPVDPVRVYPATAMLERGEYLAGVGVDGADVPPELAQEWVDAGLATLEPPAASVEVAPDASTGDQGDGGHGDAKGVGEGPEGLAG